jgi:hypothetical protein
MLCPVEILENARRSTRRSVAMTADVISPAWDKPRCHRVADLSPEGMRVLAGTRLPEGELVVVCFTPPGDWLLGEITAWARVVRSEARDGDRPASMGLELVDLEKGTREFLAHALLHRPPPLPRTRVRPLRELVWIDLLVTYTEDLGDRVNTFEVSEVIGAIEDEELRVAPLAALLA